MLAILQKLNPSSEREREPSSPEHQRKNVEKAEGKRVRKRWGIVAQRRWLLHSHSQLGSTFFKRQTSSLHLSIWPPNHHTINSYYPQDVRPPPRRRATPIKTRTRDPPNSNFRRRRAFRDDSRACTKYTGLGWAAAASLRHPCAYH